MGYPDISALGYNMLVVFDGAVIPSGGTSASGPVAAALMTIINDKLFAAGKAAMGWFNPTLYSLASTCPSCFQDIVIGNNAAGGWDAVSGLGSLDMQEVLAALL